MKLDGINTSLPQMRTVTESHYFNQESQNYLIQYWTQFSPTGRRKVSFLTSLRAFDTSVSLALYPITHLPGENSGINLCKASCTPQRFLKETMTWRKPRILSAVLKKLKKYPNTTFWTFFSDLGTNISVSTLPQLSWALNLNLLTSLVRILTVCVTWPFVGENPGCSVLFPDDFWEYDCCPIKTQMVWNCRIGCCSLFGG